MTGFTYAIPDLHGRLDLLLAAFDRIEAHAGAASALARIKEATDAGT